MAEIKTQDIWIDSGRGKLYAKCWTPTDGRASVRPPIVLLHDSLGCVALWRDFPERLACATGHGVIAYDRLGFGRSDPHPGCLTMDFISAEAHEGFAPLVEQLEVDRFIVLGHSVGGGMAVSIASAYPSRCQAVITEAAQSFVEDRTLEGIRAARDSFSVPGQMDRLEKYHGGKAQWVLDAWVDTWLLPEFARWNLDEKLPLVHCPILCIHGEDDEYGSVSHPRRMMELATASVNFEYLPKCGHVPHREETGKVLEVASTFLGEIARNPQ